MDQAGAHWPARSSDQTFVAARHWAFEAVRPVPIPDDPSGWSDSPIDSFVLQKLNLNRLRPATAGGA